MSDLELQKYFEFDEADLIANRSGKLSKKQEEKFQVEESINKKSTWKFVLYMALFSLALITIILATTIPGGLTFDNLTRQISNDPKNVVSVILAPCLVPGIFIAGALWLSSVKLDLSVMKAEGKVKFLKVEKRRQQKMANNSMSYRTVEEYELRVGRKAFEDIDEEMINILEEGDIYAFYYTKDAEQVLSCEFISKGK